MNNHPKYWLNTIILFLLIFLFFNSGCSLYNKSDLPIKNESLKQFFYVSRPTEELWPLIKTWATADTKRSVLVLDDNSNLIVWTERLPWNACIWEDSNDYTNTTALYVLMLEDHNNRTKVYFRTNCYKDIEKRNNLPSSHYKSEGIYEEQFIKILENVLKDY